jgi:serine/threonine-protein kinase HipA
MSENSLKVFANEALCGELSFEKEQYVFNYKEEAKDIVSLTMPLRKASWISNKLHPIFEMNMPEGALKEAIKNHFAKITSMDELNFLRLIGPYMLGRVKFHELLHVKESLFLDEILHSTKANLFEELMEKFAIRSGVSGIQPKLLLSAQNKTTMKFEHFIVKSWESNYPQLALNEYFCMRAIENANLPTPEFYLSEDLSMFVMKRFDVKENGSYLGFEDMCVLSARSTDEKYNGSYEEVARILKDVINPTKKKEALKNFFKAIVMNHLLQNGDGHLKNYGVLYEKDYNDAYMAPIYDVITTTVYIKNDIPALKLGDGKLWWKEKSYKTFATLSCNLSNKEYSEVLGVCYQAIKKTKQEMQEYSKTHLHVKDFLEKLQSCWREEI